MFTSPKHSNSTTSYRGSPRSPTVSGSVKFTLMRLEAMIEEMHDDIASSHKLCNDLRT